MKTRLDFVSNSSSSSYIVAVMAGCTDRDAARDIAEKVFGDEFEDVKDFFENKKNRKKGRLAQNDIESIKKKIPKSKHIYEGLGHDEFCNRFEEVVTACAKNGAEELQTLLDEKDAVFTSKIPVYSTAFRPVLKTSETMFYDKTNKWFSQIVAIQCKLKDMALPCETIQALNFIQNYWIDMTEHLIADEVSKKDGFVRSEIVGGTITPDETLSNIFSHFCVGK